MGERRRFGKFPEIIIGFSKKDVWSL
jgi:hypothetical protein